MSDDALPRRPRGATGRRRDQMATDGEEAMPKLPSERDESPQSQNQDGVRQVIAQAAKDQAQGQQDTGRKPPLEQAYEQQKGAGAAGAPAAPDRSGAGEHPTDAGHGPGDRRSASVAPMKKR